MEDFCPRHGKEYEMHCQQCSTEMVPLCALCVCEHNLEVHKVKTAHIDWTIQANIKQLGAELKKLDVQQAIVTGYCKRAEKDSERTNEIKGKLEDRINDAKELLEQKAKEVLDMHAGILEDHEAVMKEANDCEHNIKQNLSDPKKTEKKVRELTGQRKYVSALNEVKRALKEDVKIDEAKISLQIEKYEKGIDKFQDLFKELGVWVGDIQGLKKAKEKLAQLEKDNANLKGRTYYLTLSIETVDQQTAKLTKAAEENKKDKETINGLRANVGALNANKAELERK